MADINKHPAIQLRRVRQNNLKGIDVDIPIGKLTVITGVSGSGKSSLAFDTLYAEGSRRYMESLTTYARQFLEKLPRPDVEAIYNVPPAIALEQRNSVTNNRTTVATLTEIYDYMRLFFASAGKQNCKKCGHDEVRVVDSDSVAERVRKIPTGTRLYILAPLPEPEEDEEEKKQKKRGKKNKAASADAKKSPTFMGQDLFRRGFQRLLVGNEVVDLSTAEGQIFIPSGAEARVLIDRIVITDTLDQTRLVDSIEQGFLHGAGQLEFRGPDGTSWLKATQGYSCTRCGELHIPPSPSLFSSNSPLGACQTCSGFGEILEVSEELVVPDKSRTLRDGAIDPLAKPSNADWERDMLRACEKKGISTSQRYKDLNAAHKKFIWDGEGEFPGIRGYFEQLKAWKYKLHIRVFIRRYQNLLTCPTCAGSRLSEAPLRFHVESKSGPAKNIADVLALTVDQSLQWFGETQLSKTDTQKTKEVWRQIRERLDFLKEVGVGYLSLNRKANSLSGGEYQRTLLGSQLGSKLSNTLYVLDEPSIGLHPLDTDRLISVLHQLRDHGNTVVVVEHDTNVMRAADFLLEIGPWAGADGGTIVAQGDREDFFRNRLSLTARYLSGELKLPPPKQRRQGNGNTVEIKGCRENNLQNCDFSLPLGMLVAVTGVSGSGKSTLIHDTLYKSLARLVLREPIPSYEVGKHDEIDGWQNISKLLLLDQAPIGRSSRSNAATYMKMYDDVRRVMATQAASARRSLSASDFSFNVDGGRCSTCKGDGYVEVDMHFMANVRLTCEECDGKRFKKHVLEVQYKGKNIDDVLHTTIKETALHFIDFPSIVEKCQILEEVGLGYLQLGQSVASLSGGECQRLKIAATLDEERREHRGGHTLYIFDEPTTGLHIHDIKRLTEVFHALVNRGHSVLFIEHNMELVAQADWVIDMGPGGGAAGGRIVAQGTPELVAKSAKSLTAKYLRDYLLT